MPRMSQPRDSVTASLLDPPRPLRSSGHSLSSSSSAHSRRAELAAAFGSDEEDEEEDEGGEDNGRRVDTRLAMPLSSPTSTSREVFFDAGEALHQSDPLGAQLANQSGNDAPPYSHAVTIMPASADRVNTGGGVGPQGDAYDFEGASYFTPARTNASRTNSVNVSRAASPGGQDRMETGAGGNGMGVRSSDVNESSVSRMRIALGRFGRFVGMRVPGATYSSLNTEDESSGRLPRSSARGVMGGGMGQDGVFANMNAKPERRRRRGENGEDRGEDDDLVDDVLPPTYETAAADVAPPYWETTIIGGAGGLHPLAPGGMGWTPGGAHVGAIEDLIVEGLPVGNFFGFAWNLLVSMSFQFVGFLLTYLLHTTHAARCGSRAGLGITLVQYGFYLRTRAMQIADGKLPDDGLSPLPNGQEDTSTASVHSVWWSNVGSSPGTVEEVGKRDWIQRGLSLAIRQTISITTANNATVDTGNATMADVLASDNGSIMGPSAESVSTSTEWLAYFLMAIGWFILLSSVLSYWRVHRWGRQLVVAARRESDNDEGANGGGEGNGQGQEAAPVGFLHAFGRALRNNSGGRRGDRRNRGHSAEDWIIFPGRHGQSEGLETQEVEERRSSDERLLHSMRSVGLLA